MGSCPTRIVPENVYFPLDCFLHILRFHHPTNVKSYLEMFQISKEITRKIQEEGYSSQFFKEIEFIPRTQPNSNQRHVLVIAITKKKTKKVEKGFFSHFPNLTKLNVDMWNRGIFAPGRQKIEDLEGFEGIGKKCPNLKELVVRGHLSPYLKNVDFFEWTKLEVLCLDWSFDIKYRETELTGECFRNLKSLKKLELVRAHHHNFNFEHFKPLKDLEVLIITDNSGIDPKALEYTPNLRRLELNWVIGFRDLTDILKLERLERLSVIRCMSLGSDHVENTVSQHSNSIELKFKRFFVLGGSIASTI